MFRRILVAVDGSEPAEWAVEVGASLADSLCGRVALVHVVDPSDPAYQGPASPRGGGNGEAVRALRREGKRLLREAYERLPPSARDKCWLRDGHAPDEILAAAREWGADVIVMGAHGRARLAPFLLGGTTDSAARQAECPVIVVARRPRQAGKAGDAGRTGAAEAGDGACVGRCEPVERHAAPAGSRQPAAFRGSGAAGAKVRP